MRLAMGLVAFAVAFAGLGLGSGEAARLAVSLLRVDDVLLVPDDILVAPGQEIQLQVLVVYEDGTTEDKTGEYTIEVRDDDVASIDANGLLLGRAEGSTHIDVFDDRGSRAGDGGDVAVPEIVELTIDPQTVSVEEGQTVALRAYATFENGWTGIDVTDFVKWTSGKRSVATVGDENGGPHGVVSALNPGEAKIRAKDPESGAQSPREEGVVTVVEEGALPTPTPTPAPTPVPTASPVPTPTPIGHVPTPTPTPTPQPTPTPNPDPGNGSKLEEMMFEPAQLDLVVGERVRLRVLGLYRNGIIADITHLADFNSRDERTVSVDDDGWVTALKSGRADVEAEDPSSGKESRYDAEISVGEMTGLSIFPLSPTVGVGGTLQLEAFGSFDNGRTGVLVTDKVNWTSGKRSVASVSTMEDDEAGVVTGLREGDVAIGARDPDSGIRAETTVVVGAGGGTPGGEGGGVLEGELLDMSFEPQTLNLLAGETAQLSVIGVFEDGSIRDVTDFVELDVRDDSVGTALGGGTILGLGEGETTIRAEEPVSGRRSSVRAALQVAGIVAVEISPYTGTVETGTTLQFQAVATYANGVTGIDVTSLMSWECSDPDVGAIDEQGLFTGIGPGDCKVTAYDENAKVESNEVVVDVTGEPVPPPPPEGGGDPEEFIRLRFEPATVFVIEQGTGQVTAYAVYGDGHEVDVTHAVTFRSRNSRLADVAADGSITTSRAGTADVKVEYDAEGYEDEFTIVVAELAAIKIDPAEINLVAGTEVEIHAIATYEGTDEVKDVTAEVGFRSSREQSAIVEEREDGTAWVLGLAEGQAFLQGKHRTEGIKTDPSTGITNVVSDLQAIKVSPTNRALEPGEQTRYKAKGDFPGGVRVDISDVTWLSLDPTIASVDETGRVTAHTFGETQIVAIHEESGISSADTSSDANVVVVGALVGLQIGTSSSRFPDEPVDLILAAGETKELKGLALYLDRTDPFNIGSKLNWFSTDPVAVPVDDSGRVSCAQIGVSVISAQDPATGLTSTGTLGDATVTCAGTVTAIRVDPATLELDFGRTTQVRAYRVLENGSEADVTRTVIWQTSDDKYATVTETGSEGGKVTGVTEGSAVITAYDPDFDVASDEIGGTSLLVDVVKVPTALFIESLDGGLTGNIGERIRLRARVTYRGGATEGVNNIVSWSSSSPGVVRMGPDEPNFAYLVGLGSATITASYPGFPEISKTLTIQVLPGGGP